MADKTPPPDPIGARSRSRPTSPTRCGSPTWTTPCRSSSAAPCPTCATASSPPTGACSSACTRWACSPGAPTRSARRVVGDVMGKYHPHGDGAIYDTLVRMAQDWNMRVPARRRPGQLRLRRRRSAGRHALHRGAPHAPRRGDDGGHRQGHGRLRADLRRRAPASRGAADRRSRTCWSTAPAGIAVGHGDQHPAAQPGRGGGRPSLPDRATRTSRPTSGWRADRARPGPDFPTARLHLRPRRASAQAYRTGRGRRRHARQGRDRGAARATASRSSSPRSPTRSTRRASSRSIAELAPRQEHRGHLGHPRRERPPAACASSSTCARASPPGRPQQPLQAHPAAGHVRHHHAGHRRPAARRS